MERPEYSLLCARHLQEIDCSWALGHCYWCGWLGKKWRCPGRQRGWNKVLVLGPVTCGEVAPEGVGRFASVSGVSTSSARAVIKSPISGYWPPPSMWTSDYSWNRHNLSPLAGFWPFQLVQWSLPSLFICWHTDSKLHRSFLWAE